MKSKKTPFYDKNVFINCPFDDQYKPMLEAIVFVVHSLGFIPRSALEINDGGVRIEKIIRIIAESKYAIHDISRTELDAVNNLPRFNMPLELGIDIGCRHLNSTYHDKCQLILDYDKHRYQKFISDIGGQDPRSHDNKVEKLIKIVRDWLKECSHQTNVIGEIRIQKRYEKFQKQLPRICTKLDLGSNLSFGDYSTIVVDWLKSNITP